METTNIPAVTLTEKEQTYMAKAIKHYVETGPDDDHTIGKCMLLVLNKKHKRERSNIG